ncbi:hypothetical protein HA402_007078 [Bradysia odoriphaga]|nr:hypothetical protein HA402_007078 [Bradysia odoriphaga]
MIRNSLCAFAIFIFAQCYSTVTAASTPEGDNNGLKIICHYHLHTWYAPDFRDYSPEVIDQTQCTHIVYTDRVRYTDLAANRTLHDGKKLFYSRVPVFRKKGINVSISFFKFNGYEFVRVYNATARATFVASLVDFMDRNHFNGFDLYWDCRSCSKGSTRDVHQDEDFIDLIRQLSEAFKPRGWLLSTFVALSEYVVHPGGFDVLKLSEYVDWMTVNNINLSQNITSHLAPLFLYSDDLHQETSTNSTVNYLIEKGVPSQKLVLPVLSIGRMYQLTSAEDNGLNAPTDNRVYVSFLRNVQRDFKRQLDSCTRFR